MEDITISCNAGSSGERIPQVDSVSRPSGNTVPSHNVELMDDNTVTVESATTLLLSCTSSDDDMDSNDGIPPHNTTSTVTAVQENSPAGDSRDQDVPPPHYEVDLHSALV